MLPPYTLVILLFNIIVTIIEALIVTGTDILYTIFIESFASNDSQCCMNKIFLVQLSEFIYIVHESVCNVTFLIKFEVYAAMDIAFQITDFRYHSNMTSKFARSMWGWATHGVNPESDASLVRENPTLCPATDPLPSYN